MAKSMSERRRQRRNYLKMAKKQIGKIVNDEVFTLSDYENMKKGFRVQGKQLRVDDLRESLEAEKDSLANQEGILRETLKAEGKKKKEIDTIIESWYESTKIWSIHSDVYDELV